MLLSKMRLGMLNFICACGVNSRYVQKVVTNTGLEFRRVHMGIWMMSDL